MKKTILITGSTDGIGKLTARNLVDLGHHVLIHGRNQAKLEVVESELGNSNLVSSFAADLSDFDQVQHLADQIKESHQRLDVLINNAGVFRLSESITKYNLDARFVVNTLAPFLLMKKLLPIMVRQSRVLNLSSAAQAPVYAKDLDSVSVSDDTLLYSQSKLAITMWTRHLAETQGSALPVMIAINPASFLGSKMVKEAYGIQGKDLQVGADILVRAALDNEFASASGKYFDNDKGEFSDPHPHAMNPSNNAQITTKVEELLQDRL